MAGFPTLKGSWPWPWPTAYRRASLIDLYLHAKFHWNQRNFLWTDGHTYFIKHFASYFLLGHKVIWRSVQLSHWYMLHMIPKSLIHTVYSVVSALITAAQTKNGVQNSVVRETSWKSTNSLLAHRNARTHWQQNQTDLNKLPFFMDENIQLQVICPFPNLVKWQDLKELQFSCMFLPYMYRCWQTVRGTVMNVFS